MKKLIVLTFGLLFFSAGAFAQLRSIPASVTDAFNSRYPQAQNVSWKDKLTYFEATCKLNGADIVADFSNKGEWKSSEAKINFDSLPAQVKDGFTKCKYADWTKGSVTELQRMGKAAEFRIYVEKSQPFQKRFLFFNADGKLIKDAVTII